MPTPADLVNVNLYAVLELPSPTSNRAATTQQIKAAVRRALLLHHPDKTSSLNQQAYPSSTPSVDLICAARDILTDSSLRREYDRVFLQKGTSALTGAPPNVRSYPTELDIVDLDDMTYSESTQIWSRECRCGNSRAYEVTESDLEIAANAIVGNGTYGELLVGCGGCSLHIKVVFEALEGEEDDVEQVATAR